MGTLNVGLDTSGRRGRQTQNIGILTNDPDQPKAQLTLAGIVRVDLVYTPQRIYFGKVHKGETVEREIILTDSGEGTLEITGLENDNPNIILSDKVYDNKQFKDGLKRFRMLAILNTGEMPLGPFQTKIAIINSNPNKSRIEIPILGEIVGDLVVQPPQLLFGPVKREEIIERSLRVSDYRGKAFSILSIEDISDGLQLRFSWDEEKKQYVLKARYRASEGMAVGMNRGLVRVHTDSAIQPVIEIQFVALVRN